MPHLVIDHAPVLAEPLAAALPALHDLLASAGFAPASIKVYARPLGHHVVGGAADAPMAHVALRTLDKPERTEAMRRAWLGDVMDALAERLPPCTLTGEAVCLPAVYQSGA